MLPKGIQAMSESDSPSKKWYYRIGVVGLVLTGLTTLFTLRKDVREAFVGREPVESVARDYARLPRQPGAGSPASLALKAGKPSAPPVRGISLEPAPLTADRQRYINFAISERGGGKRVAILVEFEDGEPIPNLESEISAIVTRQGVEPEVSFFKPAFTQEGKARGLFLGDWTVADELQLKGHVDYVLIGFGNVSYRPNDESNGLLTADLRLTLKCLDIVSHSVCGNESFAIPGAGYSEDAALEDAVEHLGSELGSFAREAF
jgi:hypothetical protein